MFWGGMAKPAFNPRNNSISDKSNASLTQEPENFSVFCGKSLVSPKSKPQKQNIDQTRASRLVFAIRAMREKFGCFAAAGRSPHSSAKRGNNILKKINESLTQAPENFLVFAVNLRRPLNHITKAKIAVPKDCERKIGCFGGECSRRKTLAPLVGIEPTTAP